ELQDLVQHFASERRDREQQRRMPTARGYQSPDNESSQRREDNLRTQSRQHPKNRREQRSRPSVNRLAHRGVELDCAHAQYLRGQPPEQRQRQARGGKTCDQASGLAVHSLPTVAVCKTIGVLRAVPCPQRAVEWHVPRMTLLLLTAGILAGQDFSKLTIEPV